MLVSVLPFSEFSTLTTSVTKWCRCALESLKVPGRIFARHRDYVLWLGNEAPDLGSNCTTSGGVILLARACDSLLDTIFVSKDNESKCHCDCRFPCHSTASFLYCCRLD